MDGVMEAGPTRLDPVAACRGSSRELIELAADLSTLGMVVDVEAAALPGVSYGLLLRLELDALNEQVADTVAARWPDLPRARTQEEPVVSEVTAFLAGRAADLQANAMRLASIEAVE